MSKIISKEIYPGVLHLNFPNQYWVTDTFMRLQEFYESPLESIQGHYFTKEEYQDIYVKNYGKFDYHFRWSGFNVPGHIVMKFFKLYTGKGALSKKESMLYSSILSKIDVRRAFYLIGTYDNIDINHEVAHALYYLNEDYRNSMNILLNHYANTKLFVNIRSSLLKIGYSKKFLRDETQAYLSTGDYRDLVNYKLQPKDLDVIDKFKTVFSGYSKLLRRV